MESVAMIQAPSRVFAYNYRVILLTDLLIHFLVKRV